MREIAFQVIHARNLNPLCSCNFACLWPGSSLELRGLYYFPIDKALKHSDLR